MDTPEQWILAKKERMKILGRLFDKRVKAEFKKGRNGEYKLSLKISKNGEQDEETCG